MPRNVMGQVRTKEFMKANPAHAPEVHHLRVTPTEDGVRITHHASPTSPAFATHSFGKEEGDEMVKHLMEHSGMAEDSEGGGEHYADENEATEA
jgi:hypothetical protein